jgi:inner membrane protein
MLGFLGPVIARSDLARSVLSTLSLPPLVSPVGLPALIGFLVAALIGGTAPDLDKPKRWWARLLAHTAFGGHRHLSHSLIGLILASVIAAIALRQIASALGVSPTPAFLGFVAGYVSHLVLDSLTVEGVPWLFPIPLYLGFPPVSNLRIRTGSLVEQFLVMPALLALISWVGFQAGAVLLAWGR